MTGALLLALVAVTLPAAAQDPLCDVLILVGVSREFCEQASEPQPPSNDPLWVTRHTSENARWDDDTGIAVAVAPRGDRVYVSGPGDYFGFEGIYWDSDYVTLAYDAATGHEVWRDRYDSPLHGTDFARAMVLAPDGERLYVTGWRGPQDDDAPLDFGTVAYEASSGRRLWVARHGTEFRSEQADAIGITPDGSRVFVAGSADGGKTGTDFTVVSYDAYDGQKLWVGRWTSSGKRRDSVQAVAVAPDGRTVYLTGDSETTSPSTRAVTAAFDARSGRRLWAVGTSAGRSTIPTAIVTSPDGDLVFATGRTTRCAEEGGCHERSTTFALDSTSGALRWRVLDDENFTGFHAALSVEPSGRRLYVTGPGYVAAYGTDSGTLQWKTQLRRASGYAVTLDPSGRRVYVAGTYVAEGNPPGSDYLVVALEARTGEVLWATRYDGDRRCPCGLEAGEDDAYSIAVDPDGRRVFVTGGSDGGESDEDFATIAYCTEPDACA